jgi:hypothetical protein
VALFINIAFLRRIIILDVLEHQDKETYIRVQQITTVNVLRRTLQEHCKNKRSS